MTKSYSTLKPTIFGFVVTLLTAYPSVSSHAEADTESLAIASVQDEQLVPKGGGDPCTRWSRVSVRCDTQYNSSCLSFDASLEITCQF